MGEGVSWRMVCTCVCAEADSDALSPGVTGCGASRTRMEKAPLAGLERPELELEPASILFLRLVGAELAVVDIDASEPADIGELASECESTSDWRGGM